MQWVDIYSSYAVVNFTRFPFCFFESFSGLSLHSKTFFSLNLLFFFFLYCPLLGDLVIVNMVSFKYLGALASAAPALAAFGVTTSGNNLVVDSGNSNGFSVTVSKSDCSINSIKYRGAEYQYKSQTSHIASGLGSSTVQSTVLNSEYRACVKRCNMLTRA